MHRPHSHIAQERGTAMVEMALVLPILLFLALAIVDFGRAINYWNDTNQIAADTARFASVGNNPGAAFGTPLTFKQWAAKQADTPELELGDQSGETNVGHKSTLGPLVVKVCAPNGTTVGNPVVVKVSTQFNLLPILNRNPGISSSDPQVLQPRAGFGTLGITGRATMRLERPYDANVMGALDPPADCQ